MSARKTASAAKVRPSCSATAEQILADVDKYQDSLLNLESVVRCIKARAATECDELVGAIELVELELARIGEALEAGQIRAAAEATREARS